MEKNQETQESHETASSGMCGTLPEGQDNGRSYFGFDDRHGSTSADYTDEINEFFRIIPSLLLVTCGESCSCFFEVLKFLGMVTRSLGRSSPACLDYLPQLSSPQASISQSRSYRLPVRNWSSRDWIISRPFHAGSSHSMTGTSRAEDLSARRPEY
jgi:hypothetical protein